MSVTNNNYTRNKNQPMMILDTVWPHYYKVQTSKVSFNKIEVVTFQMCVRSVMYDEVNN